MSTANQIRSIAADVVTNPSPRSSVNISTSPFSEAQYLWLQNVNEHAKANSAESRQHLSALCEETEEPSLSTPDLAEVIKAIRAAQPSFMELAQLRDAAKKALRLTERGLSPMITSLTPIHFFRSTSEN